MIIKHKIKEHKTPTAKKIFYYKNLQGLQTPLK